MLQLIRDRDAPRFGQDGFTITGLIAPSRGTASLSAWRIVAEPGAASPVHRLTGDEAFVVVRGAVEVTCAGTTHTAMAGDALAVPPGVDFQLANRAAEPFEVVACLATGTQAQVGDAPPFTPPWAA